MKNPDPQFRMHISCTSNTDLNEYFRSNEVITVEADSVWAATLELLHETGELLKSKVKLNSKELFVVYGFIDSEKLMVIYDASITFEKSKMEIDRGFKIPKNSPLQEILPTEIKYDFTIDLGDSEQVLNGKFPGE